MNTRTDKIGAEMQRCLAEILKNLKNVTFTAMVSVMRVEVVRDLKHANVYLSVYGNNDKQKENFDIVKGAKAQIRHELSVMLKHMRSLPELHFFLDDSLAYSEKINRIINDLNIKKE